MPKRIGHLYEKSLDKDYIRTIIYRAACHREKRPDIARTLSNIDSCVNRIYSMLRNDSYVPHEPKVMEIYDDCSQKTRRIQMVPFFPDCIIQWIVVDLLKPILMRGMDPYSSSSIPKRGCHHIYRRFRGFIRRNHKNAKYAVQMDVHHYYDNIDIDILMGMLRRKCKDERLLSLVGLMLRSSAPVEGKGIAIGFYLNQWAANFYLENVDREIHRGGKRTVGCYCRHMDNISFIGRNKRKLKRKMHGIIDECSRMGLQIKHDYQLFPLSSRDIRGVGYRFYGDGKIRMRKRNWLRLRRTVLGIGKRIMEKAPVPARTAKSFLSRWGSARKYAPSGKIFLAVNRNIDIGMIRRIASV